MAGRRQASRGRPSKQGAELRSGCSRAPPARRRRSPWESAAAAAGLRSRRLAQEQSRGERRVPPPPPHPHAAAAAAPARLAAAIRGRQRGASAAAAAAPPAALPTTAEPLGKPPPEERMERTAFCWGCSVLFFHLFLILGSCVRIGTGSNYSELYESNILPCKDKELQCGNGVCLMNWLHCHYKKDCGNDNASITVTCSEIQGNKTSRDWKVASCYGSNYNRSMPDSSVLVAGVVIGVVLFLSCVAIIIGSLRKNRCFRHLQLQRDASYTPDCFSYGGSIGELRSSCIEEFPPSFYFSSYVETLSQVNITHSDSPPCYEECVGATAAAAYIPTDDPPPYTLIDPCRQNELSINIPWEEEVSPGTATERDAGYLVGPQDLQQPMPSASLSSSLPMEAAPPYETVVCEQNAPLPLVPLDALKNSTNYYRTVFNRIM